MCCSVCFEGCGQLESAQGEHFKLAIPRFKYKIALLQSAMASCTMINGLLAMCYVSGSHWFVIVN